MAPKKKKTKEELEAERLKAEEDARKALEEEVKAQKEAERKAQEDLERKQKLQEDQLAQTAERVKKETAELQGYMDNCTEAQAAHAQAADEQTAWQRYTQCSKLPDPRIASRVDDYLAAQAALPCESLPDAMTRVRDALIIIAEARAVGVHAAQRGEHDAVLRLERCCTRLYGLIRFTLDYVTAWFLHHCDLFADAEGNVKHEVTSPACRWAIWLNINKNPRLKAVEFPSIGVQLEIQKQLALAPIAIRAQIVDTSEEYFEACKNEYYAVGPLIKVELLSLPPMCKHTVNEWTLRVQGPLATQINRLPYPIPPAGADPNTWQSEEAVPPLTITTDLQPDIVQLNGEGVQRICKQVGMWDQSNSCWSRDKVASVTQNEGQLSFKVTALQPCAVICSRAALLPYASWTVRPAAGDGGNAAMLSLDVGFDGMLLEFLVSAGTVSLRQPVLGPLAHLVGVEMQPRALLAALAAVGMFLMPSSRDAPFADVVPKDPVVEGRMCDEVARLAGSHLVASSKWTQFVEAGACICRVAEVHDWEEGGRTSSADVDRIFSTELETGPNKVMAVLRTGDRGVAFCKALNRCAAWPELPGYDDERKQTCIWGEEHASLLSLLEANFAAELSDEVVVDIAQREEDEAKRRSAEAKRIAGSVQAELEEYAKKGEKAPEELQEPVPLATRPQPLYYPTNWPQVAAELKPAQGTMARAKAFSPLTSETLAQLMFALRVFSFSVA